MKQIMKSSRILPPLLLLTTLLAIVHAQTEDVKFCEQFQITDPQCLQEYKPVIGFHFDGRYSLYSNECYGCSDKRVVSISKLYRCSLLAMPMCMPGYDPVCGLTDDGLRQFDTACLAWTSRVE